MNRPRPLRRIGAWRKRRKRKRARKAIFEKLDLAYSKAQTFALHAASERLIILSDQHKGARDGADDFQRSERSYNAALTYYNHLRYRLVVLGDAEELWENSFEEVASQYPAALALEAAFHADGRYLRVFGNHDIAWSETELFQEKMAAHGVGNVAPVEAVKLRLLAADDRQIGELFLVHGHQGSPDSDLHARRSRFLVRHGWRRLQRRLNRPWNTPSVDWGLRGAHAEDMADWAAKRKRVLIAGHTHLPVFFESEKRPVAEPHDVITSADAPPEHAEALRLARRAWAEAEQVRLSKQRPVDLNLPCYFNTGCCSFGDGDITGIEISDGEIRLVRWPCEPQVAEERLAGLSLKEVFRLVRTGPG